MDQPRDRKMCGHIYRITDLAIVTLGVRSSFLPVESIPNENDQFWHKYSGGQHDE